MSSIRKAETIEAEILTDIAIRSEAYWDYDSDFMETFKTQYSVTEEFIRENPTFVMEEDGDVIGFYSILRDDKEAELEYLYVEPSYIGKGYGKLLWNHMVDTFKSQGIDEIVLVTSPQAKEFYIKMGAILTGEVESVCRKGRKIPRLVYTFERY